jgi:hypothetical protein
LRAGAITSLFAIALQESVEFSLQMPGNAALLAVVCAIGLQRGAGSRDDHGDDQPPLPPRRPGRSLRLVAPERRLDRRMPEAMGEASAIRRPLSARFAKKLRIPPCPCQL